MNSGCLLQAVTGSPDFIAVRTPAGRVAIKFHPDGRVRLTKGAFCSFRIVGANVGVCEEVHAQSLLLGPAVHHEAKTAEQTLVQTF